MIVATILRRVGIFGVVAGAGVAVVVWAAGGFLVEGAARRPPAGAPRPRIAPGEFVPLSSGAGLGPGRRGRLDRDDVAVVRGRAVPFRELTAEWETSEPVPTREAGVSLQRLGGARLAFFPRPTDESPEVAVSEVAPGVTTIAGREALLRRRENGPVSAQVSGDCVASHAVAAGDALVLRSDTLDLRTEDRGAGRLPVRILETDDAVRLEGGGSEVTGKGLTAEFETDRRTAGRRAARIREDVVAVVRNRPGRPARDGRAGELRVTCDGAADVEAVDRATRDGRQPWRVTFRDDVRFEEPETAMTAALVVVDLVRTGAADRAAGAGTTEVRSVEATGKVRIDGRREGADAYHVECDRLHRFAEDAVTDVTVLEGAPVLRFAGRSQSDAGDAAGTGAVSVYEVRCTGPARLRERRAAAGRDAAAQLTLVFEGDVVAVERAQGSDDVRSEVRAPRVTIEARRAADGRIDPSLVRAEQGATTRHLEFAARAQTITAVAARAGVPQRFALVGSPAATWRLREGASPLGGAEAAGLLALTSDGRIDVDVSPEPASGRPAAGTRIFARVNGGMTARKLDGDAESWRLTANDGDARVGWDGAIEEMHAVGDARLSGRSDERGGRVGEIRGEKISVARAANAPGGPKDAWKHLDAVVDGAPGRPAVAALADAADAARRDEVRAARIVRTDGGATLVASGAAQAVLHRSGSGEGGLTAAADEMRLALDPDAGGRARPQRITLTGNVALADAMHRLTGARATYDPVRGEAEAAGAPAARLWRTEDPQHPSYAAGPVVRAWFDAKAPGADRFLRASLPSGGEIVAYFASPARQRVTTRCTGPLDLTRTAATCVGSVTCVYESRRTDGAWNADSRMDARRVDMALDPTVQAGRVSDRIRSLTATGTPDDPARVRTRDPAGRREAYAEAERIEGSQWDTKLRLSCPSERSSVYLHQVSESRRFRCDSVTFDYVTYEWEDFVRGREVE